MKTFLQYCQHTALRRFAGFNRRLVHMACAVAAIAGLASAASGQTIFSDDFTSPTVAPLIVEAGNWAVTGNQLVGGVNSTTSYAFVYATNSAADYTVQAQLHFSTTNAWSGGLGGRLDTNTGAHYAAWVYPENSPGGTTMVQLIKFSTWSSFGYRGTNFGVMAVASLPGVGTNNHLVKLGFLGSQITVSFDGTQVISTNDVEASPYASGAISLDFWTDAVVYNFYVSNLLMSAQVSTPVANNDSYNAVSGRLLTVAVPGILANDTGGIAALSAALITSPAHGTFAFNTNGSFTYTPAANFTGLDTFTYKATDGHTTSAVATVNLNVAADHAPVANADSYLALANNILSVTTPGVLANDTDVDGDSLTAAVAVAPAHGILNLNANGGFTYTPATNFSGADSFTYNANDGALNSASPATATINVLPATTFFFDAFTRASDPGPLTPWITQSGNWTVTGGALVGGTDPTQTYGYAYLTNVWTDYSVQAQIQFSAANGFGGGIGGRLNPATGAHYGAWVYPENSTGGSSILKLIKFQTWTSFSYNGNAGAAMQTVALPGVGTGLHTLKLAFLGNQIAVYYDGVELTNVTDVEAQPYLSGGVTAENWTDQVGYTLSYRNAIVSALANDNSYSVNGGSSLIVGASGVLTNDTDVVGAALGAVQMSGPASGVLALNANGGFTYTPNAGFSGQDSFTYRATDGATNLGTATVYINVISPGPAAVFSESFDSVTAPALPAGWTTSSSGAESNWITQTATRDTSPNAAFCPDVAAVGQSQLVSPAIILPSGAARLTFRHNYNFEIGTGTDGFDGAELRIKIGTNAFTDILAAGGAFISGGYNSVIDTNFSNPLAGQPAWSGSSGGFITTVVNLPDSVSGQTIQLMWFCGTDSGNGAPGWFIDSMVVSNCPSFGCWNTAPVLSAQTNRTVNELTLLTVTNAAVDANVPAQTLTYSLTSPPAGASIASTTGVITWTPAQNQSPGTNTITTVVTDNGSPAMSATNKFTVVVKEVNVAPSLPAQNNRTNAGLATITVTNTATNANIHASNAGYTLVGAPSGASISTTGIITWTPTAGQVPSTNLITTVVTNSDTFDTVNPRLTATNSFNIVLATLHNGPSLPAQSNLTNNELVLLTVTNAATDIDVPVLTLTYSLSAPTPSGVSISTSGVITWTPAQNQSPSTNTIVTVVTDNGSPNLKATNSFTVVVKEVNVAPSLPAQSGLTNNELALLTVTNTATNVNIHSTNFGYGLVGAPAGMSISTNGIITWTPAQNQSPGTNLITTVVTNNNQFDTVNPQLKATNSFTVVVREVNVAPSLPGQNNRTIVGLAGLTVTNTATNVNIHATNAGYTLLAAPSGAAITTNGIITWTPVLNQVPSTNLFTTVVTNGDPLDIVNPHLTATNSFTVTVNAIHNGPSLPAQSGRTNNELVQLTVTNTATDTDIPALALTYSVVAPTPSGVSITTNGVITWTPAQNQSPSTNTITTVVTDNGSPNLSATNSFTVVVREVNVAPTLPVQPNFTNNELTLLTVTNAAANANQHATVLGYGLVGAPAGASIDPNGVFTWTPGQNQSPGTNLITTVVTNSDPLDTANPQLTATNSFTVVVKEVNVAPTLPAQSDRSLIGLASLLVTNTATNANIHATNAGYGLLSAPSGAGIDANGVITWTPVLNQVPSTNLFTTVVTNSDPLDTVNPQLTATNSFTVTVGAIHNGPSLSAQTGQTVNELALLTVTNTATDTDIPALALNYSLVAPTPSGVGISPVGIITWTPNQNQSPSTNTIVTVVTDNGSPNLSATNSFTVIVKEVNVAPTLPVQPNFTNNELTLLTVTNTAANANQHATVLGYGLIGAPAGASIDANGIFTWTPGQNQSPGTNLITTIVTNSDPLDTVNPQLTATNSFTVVVTEVNVAPTLPAQSDRAIVGLANLIVTNSATNANIHATNAGYGLLSAPAGTGIDANGVITWTPVLNQVPSTNLFTTVVTNSNPLDTVNPQLTATNSFTVTVAAIHNGPSLSAQNGQTVNELALLTVTNTATDTDIPALALNYAVVAPTPSGVSISPAGIITWTPNQNQSPSTNTITTVVTDNGSPNLSATNSFTVIVKEINVAPTLPAQSNFTNNELTLLTVTNTAGNANIHSTVLGYGLVGAPIGASIDTNGVITWTPSQNQSPGTNLITTVVTNSNPLDTVNPQLTATNSFTVVVKEVNVAPTLLAQNDLTITAPASLIVTNASTNSNIHATISGYALLSAPGGAGIDANGVITWTPAANQMPSTNLFVTVVTNSDLLDTVNPQLTATNSFTVTVHAIHNGPNLLPQPALTIIEPATLTVTNTAVDADIPALALTYSVVSPTPAGVNISSSGVITWTPGPAQAPSTNTITTVVTDSASPSMSATNSFTVIVLPDAPAPVIQSITAGNGAAVLTWSSVAGRSYRQQYQDDASSTNWTDISPDVSATGQSSTGTNNVGNAGIRFFRVRLLP